MDQGQGELMSVTLSATQQTAVARKAQNVVHCVLIGTTSPLAYCDGQTTQVVSGTVYQPRSLAINGLQYADPETAQASLTISDLDGTLGTSWLTQRFTGVTVTITKLVRSEDQWVAVWTLPWTCDRAQRDPGGNLTLALRGGGGLNPRAGLEVATRDRWRYAPEPGQAARVGMTIVQV
jgi:hypothetical protein